MLQDGSEDAPRGPKAAPRRLKEAKELPKEASKTRFSITWFSDMYRGTPPRRSLEASLDSMLGNFVSPASPQSYIKD